MIVYRALTFFILSACVTGCSSTSQLETQATPRYLNPASARTEKECLDRLSSMGNSCAYLDDIYLLSKGTTSLRIRRAAIWRLGKCGDIRPYEDFRDGKVESDETKLMIINYLIELRSDLKRKGLSIAIHDRSPVVAEYACREVYYRDIDGVAGSEEACKRFPSSIHVRPPIAPGN